MNPWEEDLTVVEAKNETAPWEEDLQVKVPRGANLGGAIRNVAQATPFLGDWMDEIEAGVRYPFSSKDYETLRRNAEESALGNIENTGYGKALNIGTNIAENSLLGLLTGGATLLPPVSALQGAIEGFGRGSDVGERAANAVVGGGLGFAIPTALNRVLPTKTIQSSMIKAATKSNNPLVKYTADALRKGTTPEEEIAKGVERGMRPNLFGAVRRESVGENVFRKNVLEQASKTYSMPYEEYIVKEINNVAPKYASKLGNEIKKLKLDELGEDIVGNIDPRQLAMEAVNKVMKNATPAEIDTAIQAMSDAIAKRGVAKKMVSAAVEKPINPASGSLWNFVRRLSSPVRNMYNLGTMRAFTVGTPNYIPENLAGRLMNFYTPNWLRGGLDAALENYERETFK